MSITVFRKFSFLLIMFVLSGCSEIQLASHVAKKIPDGGSKSVGAYKVGSPYTIKGIKYYPQEYAQYDQTGVASWYGPGFHGKLTANGEKFDMNELTAAHKTLPMPSLVRVTNLENGRSLVLRVNDRGPFAHSRIIDISKKGAELLGFKNQGVAKVRVQLLKAESARIAAMARQGMSTYGEEIPLNRKKSSQDMRVASSSPSPISSPSPSPVPQTIGRKPDAPQSVVQTAEAEAPVPVHMKNGVLYPDAVLKTKPVAPTSIYVQIASFGVEQNARNFANQVDGFDNVGVYPIRIDGKSYYRVRIPAKTVREADDIIKNLHESGRKQAIIIID